MKNFISTCKINENYYRYNKKNRIFIHMNELSHIDKDQFFSILSEKLYESRLKSGLSQEEVANKIGLTRASVINIEKGRQKVNIYLLWKFAELYSKGIQELLPPTNEPKKMSSKFERTVQFNASRHNLSSESVERLRLFTTLK
ncbi:helix-turn-helix transcriptional regulator [Nonlabens xiamenensis]|uniref:helix-turn-helix transcriptional regulator n=1 Tax=Nonlabens xiamenensis TaxID=2341043 RepID=UPI000F615825|nr:helix-turn-helix transcriptional regulator [Nonlabens xiamenensis]